MGHAVFRNKAVKVFVTEICSKKLCNDHKSFFLIPISLQPDNVNF